MINPYVIGGVALAFLAVGGWGLYQRGEAAQERTERVRAEAETKRIAGELATAVAVNKANDETIGRLRAEEAANAKGAADLADQLRVLNESIAAGNKERQDLKGTDVTVKDFLDLPIPPALQRGVVPVAPKAGSDSSAPN